MIGGRNENAYSCQFLYLWWSGLDFPGTPYPCFRLFKLGHHPFSRVVKGSIDAMRYRFLAQRFFLAASNRRFVRFLISAAL